VSYYTWRKDRIFKILEILSRFESLEKVWVCFVGCGPDMIRRENALGRSGGLGGSWLDAVRLQGDDSDAMLRSVEREVLEDVEEMERSFLATGKVWKRPVVGVIRDRKALLKEWEG